jgi:hypothetical protein
LTARFALSDSTAENIDLNDGVRAYFELHRAGPQGEQHSIWLLSNSRDWICGYPWRASVSQADQDEGE